jgi:hypothetical protein
MELLGQIRTYITYKRKRQSIEWDITQLNTKYTHMYASNHSWTHSIHICTPIMIELLKIEKSPYKTRIVKKITIFCCRLSFCLSVCLSVCRWTLALPSPSLAVSYFCVAKGLGGGGDGTSQTAAKSMVFFTNCCPIVGLFCRNLHPKTFHNMCFKMVDRSLR